MLNKSPFSDLEGVPLPATKEIRFNWELQKLPRYLHVAAKFESHCLRGHTVRPNAHVGVTLTFKRCLSPNLTGNFYGNPLFRKTQKCAFTARKWGSQVCYAACHLPDPKDTPNSKCGLMNHLNKKAVYCNYGVKIRKAFQEVFSMSCALL